MGLNTLNVMGKSQKEVNDSLPIKVILTSWFLISIIIFSLVRCSYRMYWSPWMHEDCYLCSQTWFKSSSGWFGTTRQNVRTAYHTCCRKLQIKFLYWTCWFQSWRSLVFKLDAEFENLSDNLFATLGVSTSSQKRPFKPRPFETWHFYR